MQSGGTDKIARFKPRVVQPSDDYLARCLARYALEHHTSLVSDVLDKPLFSCMKSGIARARQYGLRDFTSLAVFIGLMLETAPNLDEHELIRGILTFSELDGVAKIDAVLEAASDETWQEVIDRHDVLAWSFGLTDENTMAECQGLNSK